MRQNRDLADHNQLRLIDKPTKPLGQGRGIYEAMWAISVFFRDRPNAPLSKPPSRPHAIMFNPRRHGPRAPMCIA